MTSTSRSAASTHFVPRISEEASGPTYSVVRLCESLLAQGHATQLVSLRSGTGAPAPFVRQFPSGLGPSRLGRSPAMLRWMRGEAERGSLGVLHNHSLWMMPNVYPGWVARRHRLPYIVSPRGTLSQWAMERGSIVKKAFWPLVQAPALASATCFHATAESELEDIRRLGFRQPVSVIPNGIDIPSSVRNAAPRATRTLLFLGRVHPKKGLDLLLPAWKALEDRNPSWQLRIVGPDNDGYLREVVALSERLGLRRAAFVGALYGQEKWDEYSRADLFVLPTHSENFGMAVAEALAAGTPAVVTRGAPWSGLDAKGAGWWVDGTVDALVAVLGSAMDAPAGELAQMGARGRRWMEDEFSWNRVATMMAQTYEWMAGGGTRPQWVSS